MKKLLLLLVAGLVILSSCNKNEIPTPDPGKKDINSMIVPSDFNYETSKEITAEVVLPYTIDYSTIKGKIDFYYTDESGTSSMVYSGLSDHNGYFKEKFLIPSYMKELQVYTSTAGAYTMSLGGALKSTLDGGGSVNTGTFIDTLPPSEILLKSVYIEAVQGFPSTLRKQKSVTVNNLVQNGDFSVNNFGTINDWSSAMSLDNKWHKTSHMANYASATTEAGEMVLKIKANPAKYGGVAQLVPAAPGDLVTFTAKGKASGSGSKTGWIYLIPRKSNGQSIAYYARQINNFTSDWVTYSVSATMPSGTVSVQVLFWHNIYGGTIFWDDAVVTGPAIDSDNDGVIDEEDDYPNDASRAYNVYYPVNNALGTLAFEDNWPHRGDYDFNDLIIGYRYKMVLNANTQVVEMFGDFSVQAIGASFKNAFGFQIEASSAAIAGITGNSITENFINLNANGTEAGQNKATFIISDNVFKQLPHPGTGSGVNTTPGYPFVQPDTLQVHITLASPVGLAGFGTPPFNPFIIVNGERGREVHLADKQPTSLANTSLFGTSNDATNPSQGKYYKSANNLPWGINLPQKFDYPKEKSVITDGFLKFAEWAESTGAEYPDWYKANISGYRDQNYIYQ